MTRVAYLIGRYPSVSHTFIQREIAALRELGVEVDTFSVWRTDAGQLLSDDDRCEFERTEVLLPPRLRAALASQARAARHVRGYRQLVARALTLGPAGLRRFVLGASWILEAVALWDTMRRRGIRHVHAHLGGTAPAVAMLVAQLGNAAERDARWTWSFTVHGPDEFADVAREHLREKVEAATFVAAVSDFARSQLMSLVDEAHWSKLHVVHCGVDLGVFAPEALDGSRRANGRDSLNVLTVGRLAPAKGHGVLLEALASAVAGGVPLRATIVGDGPRRPALERLATQLGLADHVTFAGAVGQGEIRDYFAAADVFCLSSFAEGVPVVLMEAMALEKPVVATTVMGIPELVVDGEHGLLVPPGRPELVAAALARLASDSELRTRLGRAGRARVAEEYDIGRSAAQLRALFDGCAS